MKIVFLDPSEHNCPAHEQNSTYAIGRKLEYERLEQFFYCTVASDYFPKDERWYKKKEITDEASSLKELIRSSKETSILLTETFRVVVLLRHHWDDTDFLFETEEHYGRFYQYSTA